MKLKTRLDRLESRPRVATVRQAQNTKPSGREFVLSLQRKLNLPLPAGCTSAERSEALQLFRAAIDAAKFDENDQILFEQFREFNRQLHVKHGSRPPTDSN